MTGRLLFLLALFFALDNCLLAQETQEEWVYIQIDSIKQKWGDWNRPDWLRYFGLDAGDMDRDGNLDIVSG